MSAYWTFYSVGWLAAAAYFVRAARHERIAMSTVFDAVLLSAILALVVGHLSAVVVEGSGELFVSHLLTVRGWRSGYLSFGGVVGAVSGLLVVTRLHGSRWRLLLDIAAPALFVCVAFGRLGCFLDGCCYGSTTTMPWGIALLSGASRADVLLVHPTQLYEAGASILAFVFLVLALRRGWLRAGHGTAAMIALLYYVSVRWLLEVLRLRPADDAGVFGASSTQTAGLVVVLLGVALLCLRSAAASETPRTLAHSSTQ